MRHSCLKYPILLALLGCHAAAGGADGPPAPGADTPRGPLLVVRPSALRLTASDDLLVPHPRGDGAVSNVVAQLERGTRVTVCAARPGWTHVAAPGGARGWVPVADTMPDATLGKATVLHDAPYYPNATGQLATGIARPGTLLFVAEHGEERSRVHVPERGLAYMATAALSYDAADVEMSHLIGHAAASDPVEAAETLDEARVRFPDSPLLDALGEHVEFRRMRPTPVMPTSKMARPPR